MASTALSPSLGTSGSNEKKNKNRQTRSHPSRTLVATVTPLLHRRSSSSERLRLKHQHNSSFGKNRKRSGGDGRRPWRRADEARRVTTLIDNSYDHKRQRIQKGLRSFRRDGSTNPMMQPEAQVLHFHRLSPPPPPPLERKQQASFQ